MTRARVWRHSILVGFVVLYTCADAALGNRSIPLEYVSAAHKANVPPDLLYAIALTESGRTIDEKHGFQPWPWTLNVSGTGQVFDSRRLANRTLQSVLNSNNHHVDVGLMQVNWHFHKSKFESSVHALDPRTNLRVGAGILRWCYRQKNDWWKAVGCYHAPNSPERAGEYRKRVRKIWTQHIRNLPDRLQDTEGSSR